MSNVDFLFGELEDAIKTISPEEKQAIVEADDFDDSDRQKDRPPRRSLNAKGRGRPSVLGTAGGEPSSAALDATQPGVHDSSAAPNMADEAVSGLQEEGGGAAEEGAGGWPRGRTPSG